MRNNYGGPCKDCGQYVPPGEGYFEKQRWGGFKVRHVLCVAIAKLEAGAKLPELSHAQQQAMWPYLTSRQRKACTCPPPEGATP